MTTELTAYKVDRTGWYAGPWDTEPDRLQWIHAGLACLIVRNELGGLCGYVGVPSDHPAYGKPYEDVDVRVHGGLTYADKCGGAICHVPDEGMPDDVWWLGFDCVHSGDAYPRELRYHRNGGIYRTIAYVKAETEQLARQLAAPDFTIAQD